MGWEAACSAAQRKYLEEEHEQEEVDDEVHERNVRVQECGLRHVRIVLGGTQHKQCCTQPTQIQVRMQSEALSLSSARPLTNKRLHTKRKKKKK
jgi:hypothetical protein